jgi:transposase-like protein
VAGLEQLALTSIEARNLTDEVKADARSLWRKLLRLYEGGAHHALGYASWHAYCAAEFELGQSRSYQLLDAGRVIDALDSTPGGTAPTHEKQARALVPLLDQPEDLNEAWEEAVQISDGKPTTATVTETVRKRNLSDEERARIFALRDEGKNQAQIAEELGRSQTCISKIVRAAAKDQQSLPRRRQPGTAQTQALAKLHRVIREWAAIGDEEYIPAPELARRIRVLDQAQTVLTRKRALYYSMTTREADSP